MDDELYSNKEEPESRKEDREQRSTYFNTPTDEEYGRGKQEIKLSTSFSLLQTQPEDMTTEDRYDFFHHAWIEYQVSGETNLLERYISGLIFVQLSVKQGIKKYGRGSEIQLLVEFKQLMEYKTFHGQKVEDLTY